MSLWIFTRVLIGVFLISLSNSNSPLVSRTFQSILPDFVLWSRWYQFFPRHPQSYFLPFGNCSKSTNYNWYQCNLFSGFRYFSVFSFSVYFIVRCKSKIHQMTGSFFLLINSRPSFGLGWVGFMAYQPLIGYFIRNPRHTYILNIYDLVGLGFMAYQPL